MNSQFKANLIKVLANKKSNKGFTLIELLVVVIIIGVLAAVALPNLLGQVGKARETEGKNGVGSINRSQQAFHFEKQKFSPNLASAELKLDNPLGVIVSSTYYDFAVTGDNSPTDSNVLTTALNPSQDGVRNYSGGVNFNAGQYTTVVCQADKVGDAAIAVNAGATCAGGTTIR